MDTPDSLPSDMLIDINPDFTLVVAQIDGVIYLRPSRKISTRYLRGVLADVSTTLTEMDCKYLDPEECYLNYALTILPLDQRLIDEDGDEFGDDFDDGDDGASIWD